MSKELTRRQKMISQDKVWLEAPSEMYAVFDRLEQLRDAVREIWETGEYLKGKSLGEALEMDFHEFKEFEKAPYKVIENEDVDDDRMGYIKKQHKMWVDAPLGMFHLKEKLEKLRVRLTTLWHNGTYQNGKQLNEALFLSRNEYYEWTKNPFRMI